MAGHHRNRANLWQFLVIGLTTLIINSCQIQAWVAPTSRFVRSSVTFHDGGTILFRRTTGNKPSSLAAKDGNNDDSKKEKENFFDFLVDPFESKIPPEYRDEIYKAEANTKAAKERGPRIALYSLLAFVGIGCAFFNAFLTELRHPADETLVAMSLEDSGLAWVLSNFLFQFLFLNKIGGGLALIAGAGSGLLAEQEYDSRRRNSEAIWEELQARKQQKLKQSLKVQQQQQQQGSAKRKKREGSKESKRMAALSEVVDLADTFSAVNVPTASTLPEVESSQPQQDQEQVAATTKQSEEGEGDKNILQTLQGFYEKADAMAASQALLLNKKLEDAGVLEKITDETGLKVIGREAATKLQSKEPKKEAALTADQPSQGNKDS